MTEDVLSYGDEGPPRRTAGRLVAGVAVAALLLAGGVALARSRGDHGAAPPPPPSSTPVVIPSEQFTPPDPFAGAITVDRPPAGDFGGILGPFDVPAFLTRATHGGLVVYDMVGGPSWAPLFVGFCGPLQRFQDAAGRYAYDGDGLPIRGDRGLPVHEVRVNPNEADRIDVAREPALQPVLPISTAPVRRCPKALVYPPLPPRIEDVHATRGAYRVIQGRFVVTTETLAFCAARLPAGCADQGWETYAGAGSDQTLPPGDLAGSYTYQGDFLVRGNSSDGTLSVVRLPGVQLVRRDRVGVTARSGLSQGTSARDGVVHVRVGGRDYALRADADVVIGNGITGLGLPKGTPETLRRWLSAQPEPPLLWLVLDTRGLVLRVVVVTAGPPTIVE